MEAWAFASVRDGSVYKFYLPREEKRIGSAFGFAARATRRCSLAKAGLGDYRALLEKLLSSICSGGMATEVVAVTPEGILVAKQALGEPLPQGDDMSRDLPGMLIEIPSRFLRADRDHPRLLFVDGAPFLVADLHARNFVRGADGAPSGDRPGRGPWPAESPAAGPADHGVAGSRARRPCGPGPSRRSR